MKPVIKKLITISAAATFTLFLLGSLGVLGAYIYITPRLPEIETLKDVQLQVPLRVYSRDGGLIAEFGEMKRSPMEFEEFPEYLVKAVLAAEDDRFFEHPGVDYQGILRAVFHLIRTGEKGQGGSTITMQVARNFFLSREKTFLRKFNEIFLALKIEGELSKEEILALYLNKIYLGKRAYGMAAAAQVYYGKTLQELSLAELAMIAGLPKAPSTYNPVVNPERALLRRNYVLRRMHELEYISQEDFDKGVAEEVHASVHGKSIDVEAPYLAEMVRNEMVARFGNEAYTSGYQVYTSIQPRLQMAANQALYNALLAYDRRHGYRGIVKHIELNSDTEADDTLAWGKALQDIGEKGNLTPAVVIEVGEQHVYAYSKHGNIKYIPWEQLNWARTYIDDNRVGNELKNASEVLKIGDVIYTAPSSEGCSWLAQIPQVSGALVSLNPDDGSIRALVGGFDFYESKFNRVTQARRQPGSSFKPFVYTAALAKGFTAASVINDAPVVFEAPGLEDTWRPENYSGKFYGPTRLRQALIKSRNLVSIRLLREIGIGYAVRFAGRFGFARNNLPRDLSLALGSGSVTPLELATGYTVFANGGYQVKPYLIDYVLGSDDRVVSLTNPIQICVECIRKENEEKEAQQHAKDEQNNEEKRRQELAQKNAELDAAWIASYTEEDVGTEEWAQVMQGPQPRKVARQAISPQTAFLMNTMMRDVIRYGTGRSALSLKRQDLAGKTGTTNDQRDAWFTGFNRDVVTIAWVGFDNPRPLGDRETGARAALPMWIDYMREALREQPEKLLEQPAGVVSVRINPETGELARPDDPAAVFEFFLEDQVPTMQADRNTPIGTGQEPADITEQLF